MEETKKVHGWWTKRMFEESYKRRFPGQLLQAKIDYEWERFRRPQEEWTKDDWVFFIDIITNIQ